MALDIGGGISIAGNLIDNADTDTYTVVLRAGEVYDFWLGGDPASGAQLNDAFLTLTGPGANLPEQDDNDGAQEDPSTLVNTGFDDNINAATITYRATVSGTYTITVEEVSGNGTGGDYVLTFTNRSFDDDIADHTFFIESGGGTLPPATLNEGPANDDVGTQSAINVGDVFHSDINPNRDGQSDVDVIAVYLDDAETYDIQLRGEATADGTLPDPHVDLLDANGDVVASDDDDGVTLNSEITGFDPTSATGTGWYFIRAHSHGSGSGSYELQVISSGGAEEVPGADTSPFNVPLNGAVEGDIAPAGDEDWYAINLVAGATYHFAASRVTLNGSIELVLVDDDGDVVETNDSDPTTAEFDFTVAAGDSGRFFAVVRGDTGAETGSYQLSATLVSAPPAPVHQITAVDDPTALGSDLTDNITGSPGDDSISGHLGNDTLAGGLGADILNGGAASDSVQPTGDDSLSGDAGNDTLNGEDGNDTVDGGADDDSILGGDGDDSILGGLGNDVINAGGASFAETVDGGDGNDTITGSPGGSSPNADLLMGGIGDDSITGTGTFDTLIGGAGNDTLIASSGASSLDGGNDNDSLVGSAFGPEQLNGGEGDDTIDGGGSGGGFNNFLNGGNGNDTFANVRAGDVVTAGDGVDHVQSLIGWTLDSDEENLTLIGGATINGNGNGGGNVIFGNNVANVLSGLAGNDTVSGNSGNDTLIGGAGKDLNTGGGGQDVIKYNALSDSGTTFASRDAINTFAHGDKIDLSAIDANTKVAGNQAFHFQAGFNGTAGQLVATFVATNSFLVQADINGDNHADFTINVYTAPGFGSFQSWDFIL